MSDRVLRHLTVPAYAIVIQFALPAWSATPLTTERVASNLDDPVYVTYAPGDPDRLFIVERTGRIKILTGGSVLPTPFLDLSESVALFGGEQGLLGLAFHPDFADNRNFFVNYTAASDQFTSWTVVSRFEVPAESPNEADRDSEAVLLTIPQPWIIHNAGWMEFGPQDGFLYIATGDGGPHANAQNATDNLLGAILRLDVDGGTPYAIPADNPFVGQPELDEIWAYGLRNPWRNGFDSATGDLYIADVGQDNWEEIDHQPASSPGGENYGWDCMEGVHCITHEGGDPGGCPCFDAGLTLPIHEHSHGGDPFRCSITGGYVYRGCAIPDFQGTYFFADFCSRQIWSFRVNAQGALFDFQERTAELAPDGGLDIREISSFGLDAYGEIYICDFTGGEIFKVVPNTGSPSFDCNNNGREDGCDIAAGDSLDSNANGVPDECEGDAPAPEPGGPACAAAGDCTGAYAGARCTGGRCYIPKNRYVSIDPRVVTEAVAYRVELVESPDYPSAQGRTWWVDVPVCFDYPNGQPVPGAASCDGPDYFGWVSELTSAPVTRTWQEGPLHISDCAIVPNVTYAIRFSVDEGGTYSDALIISTARDPDGATQSWGDITGGPVPGDPGKWLAPEGATNFGDVQNTVRAFENHTDGNGAPPRIWVDVEINRTINLGDVQFIIGAFEGTRYTDVNLPLIGNHPADCP